LTVVFLWLICGGRRGKDGRLTVTFSSLKIRHKFQLYFGGFIRGSVAISHAYESPLR
jgi:hypothetical protein